ncbi:MAG TPA: thioesterase family protein, partial [Aestuariivirgaceae bacterium]|nr:thioesterase family protein [Aestuariivirgaceae bacterium]
FAYTIVFSEALVAFMEAIGLDAARRRETGCTLRVSELRIAFLREFHEGDAYEVRLRILDRQPQSLRLFGQMIDAESGLDAALADQLLIYVNDEGPGLGKACAIPEAIGLRIDQLHDKDAGAPLAPWLASPIGIRRKR